MATNEAFSRVRIDAQLRDQGWDVLDTTAVRFEYVLPDGTRAESPFRHFWYTHSAMAFMNEISL